MSSLLDFVQTMAIINLQKECRDKNQKLNPLELEPTQFFFYTLTNYNHKDPENTIELIQKYKGDENGHRYNNFSNRVVIDMYSNLGIRTKNIYEYLNKRNEIINELISFYNEISQKSNFYPSQYHIDVIQKLADKINFLDNTLFDELQECYIKKEQLQQEEGKQQTKGCLLVIGLVAVVAIVASILIMISN
jgi:hypothetical protein